MQEKLPMVRWGNVKAGNKWQFKYLGSINEAGGGEMADVKARIAMARQRFGEMCNIW